MYQSGRAGDEVKKRKSPAKSGRVGIYAIDYKCSVTSLSINLLIEKYSEWFIFPVNLHC